MGISVSNIKSKIRKIFYRYFLLCIYNNRANVQLFLFQRKFLSLTEVATENSNIAELNEHFENLLNQYPDISKNNLQISILLKHPYARTSEIKIASHIDSNEIEKIVNKKIKSKFMDFETESSVNISYYESNSDIAQKNYFVSFIKTDLYERLIKSFTGFHKNIGKIIPSEVIGLEDDLNTVEVLKKIEKYDKINHAEKESNDFIKVISGKEISSKLHLIFGISVLLMIIFWNSFHFYYQSRNQDLLMQMAVDRTKYSKFKQLNTERDKLVNELKTYYKYKNISSSNSWIVAKLEEITPKEIVFHTLVIESLENKGVTVKIKGNSVSEKVLYKTMDQYKKESFMKNVKLEKIIRDKREFCQFNLYLEIQN